MDDVRCPHCTVVTTLHFLDDGMTWRAVHGRHSTTMGWELANQGIGRGESAVAFLNRWLASLEHKPALNPAFAGYFKR